MGSSTLAVILGLVAGIVSLVATRKLLRNFPTRVLQGWLRPWNNKFDDQYLQKAGKAISGRLYNTYLLPFCIAIAIAISVCGALLVMPPALPLQILAAFGGVLAVGIPSFLLPSLQHYRRKVANVAARQLVRHVKPEEATALLVQAAAHPDKLVRLAAITGLRELGTNSGTAALQKLGGDQDATVAAAARDAMADLLPALKGTQILSVRTMETYIGEHRFLTAQLASRNPREAFRAREKLDEITRQIDEIVYSQLSLRRTFPDVFCGDCYSRAEVLNYEEWHWVRCKQCHEVHGLRTGVRTVVGEIGAGSPTLENGHGHLENGTLRVSLWNGQTQKARYGEVDVLVVTGGQGINYDWAISAVIEKMLNQSKGPRNMVSVKLVGNPVLEVNTLHLLRTLDPGVMGGGA
jgi:hypothetical protein